MQNRGIILLLITTLLLSCSPKALREAEEVVAQADSLRAAGQMYGIDAGDSATLAQAYETLGSLSLFNFHFSPSYAHVCYHYGRLLREKDNPVEAMQCFINATHARTRDYHILGRVYSNMGDIAHLAGEFPLAYDMYEHSAEMFLHNGDSLLYYYDLNNMAFELAEQGKKEECLKILHDIDSLQDNEDICAFLNLTKSALYKQIEQNDSAIYYAYKARVNRMCYVDATLFMAQSYSFLGQKDSAVYYAQIALENTSNLFHISNALYILTNDDEAKDKVAILNAASERADVQKLLEIRQGKMSQAVQLLEQDLARKPNLAWLYAICATLIVVGLVVLIYVHRKRRQRSLLSQQVEDLTIQNKEAEERQAKQYHERLRQIQENCEVLACSDNVMDSIQWKKYENFCEFINAHFFLLADKLKAIGCLNEKEIRLCVLVLIGSLSDKQMANILYYSYKSIRSTKRTLAIKLGTTSANLRSFLMEKAAK